MTVDYECTLDRHSIMWGSGLLTVNHYEIGLVSRLAQDKFVPVSGGPWAREFVERLTSARIDPAALLRAIVQQGMHVPDFAFFDDPRLQTSTWMQSIVESVLLTQYDAWLAMDRAAEEPDAA